MSYETPKTLSFVFPTVDIGAGNGSAKFRLPKGMKGRVLDIHLSATETFTAVTTPGTVALGTASDADAYVDETSLGTLAAGECVALSVASGANFLRDADGTIKVLPADTDVVLTYVAPTGGTPAGIATITVFVEAF